jgi:RNA polymerase sigma-70 factor (ECF subfamily)
MENAAIALDRPASVESVYREDGARLWRAVYAYSLDRDIASEAVSEAYAQALRRGDAIRDVAAWTWRVAFRIAAGALKDRRSDEALSFVLDPHEDRYADVDLLTALRHLPDGQRAAVLLYYYADLPVREIATRLGSNEIAVRANLSRGRRRLHALLGDDDD